MCFFVDLFFIVNCWFVSKAIFSSRKYLLLCYIVFIQPIFRIVEPCLLLQSSHRPLITIFKVFPLCPVLVIIFWRFLLKAIFSAAEQKKFNLVYYRVWEHFERLRFFFHISCIVSRDGECEMQFFFTQILISWFSVTCWRKMNPFSFGQYNCPPYI